MTGGVWWWGWLEPMQGSWRVSVSHGLMLWEWHRASSPAVCRTTPTESRLEVQRCCSHGSWCVCVCVCVHVHVHVHVCMHVCYIYTVLVHSSSHVQVPYWRVLSPIPWSHLCIRWGFDYVCVCVNWLVLHVVVYTCFYISWATPSWLG